MKSCQNLPVLKWRTDYLAKLLIYSLIYSFIPFLSSLFSVVDTVLDIL